MNKKIITIIIILIFISVLFLPTISALNKSNDDSQNRSIIGINNYIDLDYDKKDIIDPIMPRGKGRTINLSINFRTKPRGLSFFYRLTFLLLIGKEADIKLEIVDKPKWCDAIINQDTLKAVISRGAQNLSSSLSVKVNEDAPAYGKAELTINASTDDIKGLFGLTRINGYNTQLTIPLVIAYLPLIKTEFSLGNTIEISPYTKARIPINITNLGNGRTKVLSEVNDYSVAWDVVIDDSVLLDVGETRTVNLIVKTDDKFDEKPVKLKFTPSLADNPEDIGTSLYTTLLFINDGSYEEELPVIIVDNIFLFLMIGIIFFLIIIIIILIKRKKLV